MDARQQRWARWRHQAAMTIGWTVTAATLIGLGGTAPIATAAVVPEGALVPVVIEGAGEAAAAEVTRLGGVVDGGPPASDGLHARVPAAGLTALCRVDGVRTVASDRRLTPGW